MDLRNVSVVGDAMGMRGEVQGMSAPSASWQGALAGAVGQRIGAVCKSLSNIAYSGYDFGKHGINCVRCLYGSNPGRNARSHLGSMIQSIASIVCGLLLLIATPFVPSWSLDYTPFQRRVMQAEASSSSNKVRNNVESSMVSASPRVEAAPLPSASPDLPQSGAAAGGIEPPSVSTSSQVEAVPIPRALPGATAGGVGPSPVSTSSQVEAVPIPRALPGATAGGVGPSPVSTSSQVEAASLPRALPNRWQHERLEVSHGNLLMWNTKSLVSLVGLAGLVGIWVFSRYMNSTEAGDDIRLPNELQALGNQLELSAPGTEIVQNVSVPIVLSAAAGVNVLVTRASSFCLQMWCYEAESRDVCPREQRENLAPLSRLQRVLVGIKTQWAYVFAAREDNTCAAIQDVNEGHLDKGRGEPGTSIGATSDVCPWEQRENLAPLSRLQRVLVGIKTQWAYVFAAREDNTCAAIQDVNEGHLDKGREEPGTSIGATSDVCPWEQRENPAPLSRLQRVLVGIKTQWAYIFASKKDNTCAAIQDVNEGHLDKGREEPGTLLSAAVGVNALMTRALGVCLQRKNNTIQDVNEGHLDKGREEPGTSIGATSDVCPWEQRENPAPLSRLQRVLTGIKTQWAYIFASRKNNICAAMQGVNESHLDKDREAPGTFLALWSINRVEVDVLG